MALFEITDRVDNLEYKMSQLIETVEQTGRYIQTMAARQDKLEAEFHLYKQELAKQSAKREAEFQASQERRAEEAAKRDAKFRAFQERLAEEAAKRDTEKAERDARFQAFQERLAEEAAKRDTEFQTFQKESDEDWKKFNREMAKISDDQGRIIEDLVFPNLDRLMREVVGCTGHPISRATRFKKYGVKEYELVVLCGDYLLIGEAKTKLRGDDIDKFVEDLREARKLFTEYPDKHIVGALVALHIDPARLSHGQRLGVMMIGVGDGIMQILNREGFKPKHF